MTATIHPFPCRATPGAVVRMLFAASVASECGTPERAAELSRRANALADALAELPASPEPPEAA